LLVAARDVDREPAADLVLEAAVDADVVARAIDLVARLEAGEHLRARELRLGRRAERRGAEAVRRRVAGVDLIALDAELAAEHERRLVDDALMELVLQIEVRDRF